MRAVNKQLQASTNRPLWACCIEESGREMILNGGVQVAQDLKGVIYYAPRCECDYPLQPVWKSASSDITSGCVPLDDG